jgi:hypothetical protein
VNAAEYAFTRMLEECPAAFLPLAATRLQATAELTQPATPQVRAQASERLAPPMRHDRPVWKHAAGEPARATA